MADGDPILSGDEQHRISVRRLLGWTAALSMLAILSTLIVMVSAANRERDVALRWQRHSFEVMLAVRTFEGLAAQAEATLGRAVISSDVDEVRLYQRDWRRAGSFADRIARLTRNEPEQYRLAYALRDVHFMRGEELGKAGLLLANDQKLNALSAYYAVEASETRSQMRDLVTAIIANERKLLDLRTTEARQKLAQSNRLAAILSAVGLLVVLGAIALGWWLLETLAQRSRSAREAEMEQQRAYLLEEAVLARTRELREANDQLLREAGERAHAEAQLRQIQKMEAVGRLTGGIAHDFNNMLAVVVGGLELARRKLENNREAAARHLDQAMEGAGRAAALTRRLLTFARAEPVMPEPVNANTVIAGMAELMDRTLGEAIMVRIESDPELWPIWADRHQLENALLNLAVNSRDAMADGGELTIRTANVRMATHADGRLPAGEYVRIDTIDTGCGIPPDVMERVYEPFFTTKPVGKGTGLGLSQVFGTVQELGGDIRIRSQPGEGTTVSLIVPRHRTAADADATPVPVAAVDEGEAMVPFADRDLMTLVVEDDPRVLISTVGALEELGFRPIGCSDGRKALALLAERRDIGLIVTDVVMPDMTGPELIRRVAVTNPDMPVLFVTGYAADVDDSDTFGAHAILRKPFTITALEDAIVDALRRAAISQRRAPAAAAAE